MKNYQVIWKINIDAENEQVAAEEASIVVAGDPTFIVIPTEHPSVRTIAHLLSPEVNQAVKVIDLNETEDDLYTQEEGD